MKDRDKLPNIDYTLLIIVILLALTSLIALHTIQPTLPAKYDSFNFMLRQLQWYIAGGIIIFTTMFIDYDRFRKITWIIYPLGLIPLFMIFFRFPGNLMVEFNNIVRGISFPLLGNIQPSEFFKIVLILTIAHVMVNHNDKYIDRTMKTDFWLILKVIAIIIVPLGMIAVQPDLGSVLVLVAITTFMLFTSGIQWRVIFSIIISGLGMIGIVAAAWFMFPGKVGTFLEESVFKHVKGRFYGWLDPDQYAESGLQLIYSLRAIGSGQLYGKGSNNMQVYVPEKHTDMIFTSIAEQFGFIGVSFLLILYFLLIYRLLQIALASNDPYGTYLVTGLIGMFTYQIFQNIGMSIQLLPITGLPLPFLSYGGSSTLTYMAAIAIAFNVHSRTKHYMFDE